MARTTPGTGIPVPESPDPRTITADLWASFSKVGTLITQTSGESAAALVTAEQAETAAAQALARALLIEDPIHVGPSEPTEGEDLWVDTGDDSAGSGVSSVDITDASTVGRAVLTAPLSVDARNALAIYTGTRALLDAGTDTAERTWDAKELHEYVAAQLAEIAYDSGPRDITPLAGGNVTSGKIWIRRTGRLVVLSFESVIPSESYTSGGTLLTVPTGFRRPRRWDGDVYVVSLAGAANRRSAFLLTNGAFGYYFPSTSERVRADLFWFTDDDLPA